MVNKTCKNHKLLLGWSQSLFSEIMDNSVGLFLREPE